MKLDDVKAEDVVWNATPLMVREAERSIRYYLMEKELWYRAHNMHLDPLLRREGDELITAISKVSYFSVRVLEGRAELVACSSGRSESIDDYRSAGITRKELIDAVLKGMEEIYEGRDGAHFPCSTAILGKLIRYYQPRNRMRCADAMAAEVASFESTGRRGATPPGVRGISLNEYRRVYAKRTRGGCLLALGLKGWENDYYYYVTRKGQEAMIYCVIDCVSPSQAACQGPASGKGQDGRPVYGLLSQDGAAEDLARILLRAASGVDRSLGKYVAFLEL